MKYNKNFVIRTMDLIKKTQKFMKKNDVKNKQKNDLKINSKIMQENYNKIHDLFEEISKDIIDYKNNFNP